MEFKEENVISATLVQVWSGVKGVQQGRTTKQGEINKNTDATEQK